MERKPHDKLQYVIEHNGYQYGPFDHPMTANEWAEKQGFEGFKFFYVVRPEKAKEWLAAREQVKRENQELRELLNA